MTSDYRPPLPRHSRENGNLHADPLVSRAVRSVSAVVTKRPSPHLTAALGLGLLLVWATWPVIVGRLPGNLDLLLQFAPNATFLQRELTAGRLPLWNPYVGAGVPFLADPGTAGWYLPSWLALLVLSTADAIRLLLIAHLAWAAAGMYWCARRALGTGLPGAFVAAAVYAGGPFATGGLAGTLPAPLATAWLPWVLLAWHRCLDRPGAIGRCVVVAVLLVIQLSAGWPPGSALTILALAAMGLWRLARDLWPAASVPWPARAALAVSGHRIAVGLLAAVLTALLSALIVVPALEFIAQTHYAESRTLAEAARADYVTVLSVFGAAGGTGVQESNQFYSSVVVLGLALVGALAPLNRRLLSAGLLLGTALMWCLGTGPRFPLFGLLYEWLPGFQVIHVPSRCALLVVCGLALLAGRGVDRATSVTWRVAVLASTAPVLLGLLVWWSDGYDPFRRFLTNVGRFADGPYLAPIQAVHLVGFGLAAAALWLAACGPWPRFARLRRSPVSVSVLFVAKTLPLALAVLVILDLLVWHGHQRLSTVPPAAWLPPPRPSLPQGDPAYRVLGFAIHGDSHFLNAFPQHVRTAQLPPNMPGLVGLRDAQAYGPLLLRRYTAYAAAANEAEPDTHWGLFGNLRSPLLDHLAVRWVLSAAPRWQVYGQPYVIERALPTDGQPVVLVQLADRPPARVVRLVTFLGEATALRDNTPVAEVEVIGRPVAPGGAPVRHTMVLRAGVDTAEWAYGRPDVATTVQHRQAPVVRRTRLLSVEAGNVTVFQYVATLRLPDILRIERIAARALPTETRAMVHVEAVWLDEEAIAHLDDTPSLQGGGRGVGAANQATSGMQVYERAASVPRARWVPAAQPVADADTALAGVRAAGADSRATTFIEAPPAAVAAVSGDMAAGGSAAEAVVQWQQDSPTRIVLRVDAPAAGWLVLADAFYPGWEARLDGQPTPIYPADGLFRAVAVPPGPHQITFDFRPRSLWLGAALSAVGVVLVAAVLWLAGRGRRSLVTSRSSKRRRPSVRRAVQS
ncbi:MAG: YfhO family protein, partial [Chloroflexota bacterium]|nr:YfhO family protein [Chloroflexota bacterium]